MPKTKKPAASKKPTSAKPAAPKKVASKKPAAKKLNKTAFIKEQPATMAAKDVVAKGKAAGLKLTEKYVWKVRSALKGKGKAAKATPKVTPMVAKVGAKARKLKRAASSTTTRTPRDRVAGPPIGIAGIGPLDLAYAVGRLVAEGRTSVVEVIQLAGERGSRIESLEAELAALKDGSVAVGGGERPVKATKPSRKAATALVPTAAVKTRPKGARKAGTVTVRKDGRTFTTTAKVVAARKAQGQYLGFLRQIPEKDKATYKAIAKEKGVPAAVVELKKKLGRK